MAGLEEAQHPDWNTLRLCAARALQERRGVRLEPGLPGASHAGLARLRGGRRNYERLFPYSDSIFDPPRFGTRTQSILAVSECQEDVLRPEVQRLAAAFWLCIRLHAEDRGAGGVHSVYRSQQYPCSGVAGPADCLAVWRRG